MLELDVETTSVQWYSGEVFLVQFETEDGERYVFEHPEQRTEVQAWLAQPDDYRAWNSKFDFHFLDAAGYDLPPQERWHDGMVAAHLLDERRSVALKAVGATMFGEEVRDHEKAVKAWINEEEKRRRKASKETGDEFIPTDYSAVPRELMIPYALEDVTLTRRVGAVHYPTLQKVPELQALYETEMTVMGALFCAEKHGLPVDEPAAHRFELALAEKLEGLNARAVDLAGIKSFNPRSSKQIAEALKRRGANLDFVTKTKTGLSMDAENLATVDDPLARSIEEFRSEDKLLGTYVRPLLHRSWEQSLHAWKAPFIQDGRIHSNIRQVGARTGRMSSSDPNIQNFPRDDLRLRYLIRSEPGHKLVTADLDSIELVLFAAYAGEGKLLDAVLKGTDMHTMTADYIGLEDFHRSGGHVESRRQRGKRFNYLSIYGGGVRAIRKFFLVPQSRAREMQGLYHQAYPEVSRLQRRVAFKLEDQGYIKSAFGRRYRVDPRDARKAVNYLVQGTAADMLKISIANLHRQGVQIIAPVHDELLAHVPEADAERVGKALVGALTDHPKITALVPLGAEAKIVDRWSQAKDPDFIPDYERP